MGMFDTVLVRCPSCGARLEFQSKAGDCILRDYTSDNVPAVIAADLNGAEEACKCGAVVCIGDGEPERRVSLVISLKT